MNKKIMKERKTIIMDGEVKNLTSERIVTAVDKDGKATSIITKENDWKYPTTLSKMINTVSIFGIVVIVIYGMHLI